MKSEKKTRSVKVPPTSTPTFVIRFPRDWPRRCTARARIRVYRGLRTSSSAVPTCPAEYDQYALQQRLRACAAKRRAPIDGWNGTSAVPTCPAEYDQSALQQRL